MAEIFAKGLIQDCNSFWSMNVYSLATRPSRFSKEVRSRVVERLTWHPASPPASRYILHDLTRDRVAVFWEVFANLCRRFIDTLAAHNATAGMNPKAISEVRLCERIELYKNLI